MNTSPPKVAVIGGGIAGLTAAWQLSQFGLEAVLFEASGCLRGTVETVRRGRFIMESGPDGWVTEKPWARELACDLDLADELIFSNDAGRVTWILQNGKLLPMPDGMRMMVPGDLAALDRSPLFSEAAKRAYTAEPGRAAELRAAIPGEDESIAAFTLRHFGPEVLEKIAGPLLSGVFGGDVAKLSVRAVMPAFVEMEREHGSLIAAMQARGLTAKKPQPIFTSLRTGLGTLVDRLVQGIPPLSIRLGTTVTALSRVGERWHVSTAAAPERESFDAVVMAVPAHVAYGLLQPLDPGMAELLPTEASSAIVVSLAFAEEIDLPKGFGFLVPGAEGKVLMACTFVDQKFSGRVPGGSRLLRGFIGGTHAVRLAPFSDQLITSLIMDDLQAILGRLPIPAFSVVRRWPRSLPQYEVGHLDRMRALDGLVSRYPNLYLLGNAYRGVGLPDLVRDARNAAKEIISL